MGEREKNPSRQSHNDGYLGQKTKDVFIKPPVTSQIFSVAICLLKRLLSSTERFHSPRGKRSFPFPSVHEKHPAGRCLGMYSSEPTFSANGTATKQNAI